MGDLTYDVPPVIDGRYRLIVELAAGGRGTTFLAEHMLIGGLCALEVMHPDLAGDADTITRFLDDALVACALRHPHVLETRDLGLTGGLPFVAYEHVDGMRLTEEIYQLGGLLPRRALRIALQVASALEAAHAAGVCKVPLSPDHVFLAQHDGSPDHVKVLAFGVPCAAPELLAPEQIERPDDADRRADVYALGALLYEMLAARRPHTADDPGLLLFRIVYEPAAPLGVIGVPEELERLILERMLCKQPGQRLQTMGDVRAALEAILDGLTFGRGSSPRIARIPPEVSAASLEKTWPPYGQPAPAFQLDDEDAPPTEEMPVPYFAAAVS